MAINRAPFNALVDDDGSNTTGTPWNKQAIREVILDPVDVAFAAGPMALLGAAAGTSTATGGDLVNAIKMPALGIRDVVRVSGSFVVTGATPAVQINVLANDGTQNATIAITGTTGIGDLTSVGLFELTIRLFPSGIPYVHAVGVGGVTTGVQQVAGRTFTAAGAVNWVGNGTTAYIVYLQHTGFAAGASLAWAWAVYAQQIPVGALLRDPDRDRADVTPAE